ncbi:hypothetical protein DID88_010110 [Monilinia fructigena]|uniref:HMA domain-containing protein n=1 Tax=Monilinia fructigena TaxID=38457 RepID=A0A395IMB1_9HELO|nr:hypothetical protein DID88_010110 [Monilinia fructigena]
MLKVSTRGSGSKSLGTPTAHMATTTVKVGGMTCGACTSAVESGFKGVDGIGNVSVSLVMERAVILHDPQKISAEKIQEIIEDRGFDAEVLATDLPSPTFDRNGRLYDASDVSDDEDTEDAPITTTTLTVEGMTYVTCTTAMEEAFKDVPGVKTFVEGGFKDLDGLVQFNVSLLAERAVVIHDPSKLPAEKIAEIIEDRGFDAKIISTQLGSGQQATATTSQFKLFGVASAADATALETKLSSLLGVNSATVSLAKNRLTISHQPNIAGLRALVDLIESQGYNALVADNDDNNAQLESLAKTREITEWRTAFKTSLSFAIPVFLISMVFPMLVPILDFGRYVVFFPGLYLGDILFLERLLRSFFSIAAMIVSVMLPPHTRPSTIFDTSSMLITFITLGRFLENRAKGQTSKALSRLMSLAPSMATIYADPIAAEKAAEDWNTKEAKTEQAQEGHAAEEKVIPTELIQVGDIVILRPGDKIPADGNRHPRVDFRVTRAGRDTQLSQIVKLVQDAQTTRAPIQRLADTIAGYFVPFILALGFLTFSTWMELVWVLKNGILVKGGAALETATKITQVVLDKTGTITVGKMSVAKINLVSKWETTEAQKKLWWSIVGLSEMGSEHPIGKAIPCRCQGRTWGVSDGTIDGSIGDFEAAVGSGISALVEPATGAERTRFKILVGNVRFLKKNNVSVPQEAIDSSEEANIKAAGSSKASSADSAIAAIAALHRMGIKTAIVTGDQRPTAIAVARIILFAISNLVENALQWSGDGINDSPALATADVGIAMAGGTDVAMEAADVVLMRQATMDIPASIQLARSIFSIKLNLSWACGYNIIGLPFAMGIFLPFGYHLHPMAAGAAMAASSVSVVGSSLLLKFWKRPRWMDDALLEEKGQLIRKGNGWGFGGLSGKITDAYRAIVGGRRGDEGGYVPLNTLEPV